MPLFYLDASALAKRYKPEKGTDVVDLVFGKGPGDRLVTSFLSGGASTSAAATRSRHLGTLAKRSWLPCGACVLLLKDARTVFADKPSILILHDARCIGHREFPENHPGGSGD